MTFNAALIADMQAAVPQQLNIVLKPISHPELGDIYIEDGLFAVGRTEAPFASYRPDFVAGLSRRHARIFAENGAVYIADLESKNGTTVNGVSVREKPSTLHDGDEICFGGDLSYRVQFAGPAQASRRVATLLSLTLTPVRGDIRIQPIVLTQFPFLIGKADDTFSRYQDEYPHQVNYISRRHAHIFVKGATPFLEDLGSTNGTFVGGKRLDEHAVPLEDGDVVGFGGNHFLYKVGLEKLIETDSTLTKLIPAAASPAADADPEKTTFVASAASFLDIFCVDHALQADNEVDTANLKQPDAVEPQADERGKFAILLSALAEAFAGGDRGGLKRAVCWGASVVAALALFALGLYLWGTPEREVKDLIAGGEFARAAQAADRYLARNPDSAGVKALGTEGLLKGGVPNWLTLLQAGDFDRAAAALGEMRQLTAHHAELRSLVSELEWIGDLEKFFVGRGGVDAPIRIYADEDKIKALLKQWNEDTQRHQRAFATISAYVPQFKDAYAEALSRLRKLQNDDSVYLAAIDRLKSTVSAELDRDSPDALEAVLQEYAEKYPRLGGLDAVRGDLRRYMEIESEARARRLGRLSALLEKAKFVTPPFEAKFRALKASDRFPPADIVQQYAAVSKAWREGDTKQAFANLQGMTAGPWADAAARELQRKRTIVEQYAALQRARGASGYEERLLSFYGALDADEDVYFLHAIEGDVGGYKNGALAQAQESLSRAEALWRQYRENGAIDGRQRLSAAISNEFRTQAQRLSEANERAQRGTRVYTQLKAAQPAQWIKVHDEIKAEAELQRASLLELRHVLEPGLLKAKLALLGGRNDDERKSP